jgi:hypothetical protein
VGGEDFVGVGHFRLGLGLGSFSRCVYDGGGLTRYHPVGLPVFPSLLWEVSTKRTLGRGAMLNIN